MRRKIICIFIMISLILSISACEGRRGNTGQTSTISSEKTDTAEKVITVSAATAERYLEMAVEKFQSGHPGYRIKLDFPENKLESETFFNNLDAGIMTGKGPDIILASMLPYEKYISKSLMVDLSERMSKDSDFNADEYYTNIFEGMKRDGRIFTLPIHFNFSTMFANQGILEEEGINIDSEKWTWDDFMTIAEKVTKKDSQGSIIRTALPYVSPISLLDYFLYYSNFCLVADTGKKSALFDSQKFIRMVESVKSFGNNNLTGGRAGTEYEDVLEAAYRGAIVFRPDSFWGYQYYAMMKAMFNGKVNALDFPSEDRKGADEFGVIDLYGIISTSRYKDEAWEFIKVLLSEDVQLLPQYGFAVSKAANRKMAEQAMDSNFSGSMQMGGKTFNYKTLTREDIDLIESRIQRLSKYFVYDDQIYQIIHEETPAFFSGDKSAEAVAELIQNRVNTYLNE